MNLSSSRRKAIVLLSSARLLPLASPQGHPGISTGFYLVELAEVLRQFQNEYDFILVTPDGKPPQLDVNGLALSFHAGDRMTRVTTKTMLAQMRKNFSAPAFRAALFDLVARRDSELEIAYRYLGKLPVSDLLPNTDKEVADLRGAVVSAFNLLPEVRYLSIRQLLKADEDPGDAFSLSQVGFIHMPGGHAPMVDFIENPWMGELLNRIHDHGSVISLICHSPLAMASARYRVGTDGSPIDQERKHPFVGARLTVLSGMADRIGATLSYPKVPGKKTRYMYDADEKLKEAGFNVSVSFNPSAPKIVWDPSVRLLTGNGPQAIDAQVKELRHVLSQRG